MPQAFYQIARQSFRECLRQPIFLVLQLSSLMIIGLHPIISIFVFREQEKLVTDGSLATTLIFGWVTAVICSGYSVSREIETGTILLILSKPVRKSTFILGKAVGVLFILLSFVWVNGIGILLAVRIARDQFNFERTILFIFFGSILLACCLGALSNFFFRRSYSASTAFALVCLFSLNAVIVYWLPDYHSGYQWDLHLGYSPNLIRAILLLVLGVFMLGILATSLSVFFHTISNFTICGIVFFVGLISDYLYKKTITISKQELAEVLNFWPYYFLLPLFVFWVFQMKKASLHTQTLFSKNILGITFFAVFAGVVLLLGAPRLESIATLQRTSPFVEIIFLLKNTAAEILYAMVPNWQHFWMADALVEKKMIPVNYLVYALGYSFSFFVLFMSMTLLFFGLRDVGDQSCY